MAQTHVEQAPPRAPSEPARTGRVAIATLIAAVGYGALRSYWQLRGEPEDMSPIGSDLVGITGWYAVALCAVAALAAAGLATTGWTGVRRRVLLSFAGVTSVALVAAGALLLLDLVGAIFRGIGIGIYPLGALSRAVCVGTGVLLAVAAASYQRRTSNGCGVCGRSLALTSSLARTPTWAFWAAYVSVAGCLLRVGTQLAVGLDQSPLASNGSALAFELAFLLAGTLLPLSLVHTWGRAWPRWMLGLAGRAVPRWLVLGPAIGVAGGIVTYFGLMQVQMILERLHGRNPFPPSNGLDLPEAFFWVAVPAYLTWGVGMAFAALAYFRCTRRPCATCGR